MRLGLTGGLASGKSTVGRWLSDLGYRVVDADRLVAELYRPGEAGSRKVAELFGADYLDAAGAVDRARLAGLVFHDPAARRRLEEAIHPLVRARFAELAAGSERPAVLEATLLVEAGYAPDFDAVVSVEAPEAIRLERAIARGLAPDDARARMAAQGDGEARRRVADHLLHNDQDLAWLRVQFDRLMHALAGVPPREASKPATAQLP